MEFPTYLRLGSITLHPHLFFELLAYGIGFRLYLQLRKQYGDPVSPNIRWWAIAAAAVGAAIGGKVLYWFEDPWLTIARWPDPFYLLGGKTIVGGLVGGLVAVEWTKRRLGVTTRTGDLFAIPLCLGVAIGRVGCFFTGLEDHTHGVPTSLPWGVNFGDGILRHPTQLYEIVFLAALGVVLLRFGKHPHENGDLFKVFMIGYMGFRLLVDFLKPGVPLAGLTAIQWVCAAALAYYMRDVWRWLVVEKRPLQGAGTS